MFLKQSIAQLMECCRIIVHLKGQVKSVQIKHVRVKFYLKCGSTFIYSSISTGNFSSYTVTFVS